MAKFIVTGGVPLSGSCRVGGAKNAALPILAACVLTQRPVRLEDCPLLTDVENMAGILRMLGCKAGRSGRSLIVDASGASRYELPEHLSKELRYLSDAGQRRRHQ